MALVCRCSIVARLFSITNDPGIGRSTAIAFAQNGVNALALVSTSLPPLENTRDELQAKFPHVEVEILRVNVADEMSVEAAIQKVVE